MAALIFTVVLLSRRIVAGRVPTRNLRPWREQSISPGVLRAIDKQFSALIRMRDGDSGMGRAEARSLIVGLLAVSAAACAGNGGSKATPTATATAISGATATVTTTGTAVPSRTPIPLPPTLTATPRATATPTATGTPTATVHVEFDVVASPPRFIIPGAGLPAQFQPLASNNNVDILFFEGRLYLAWRTAPYHFAGPDVRMYIMSSADGGQTWDYEHEIALGTDVREPRLLGFAGYLQLMFFEAGSDPGQFTPRKLWRTRRVGPADWSDLELLTDAGEVPWDLKVHDGIAYRTSYMGDHYGSGDTSDVSVFFKQSTDGTTWTPVGDHPFVYYGGVSEVAFDFATDGTLYAVTRNEDGDATGFGSHVCYASAEALGDWHCPSKTDPERYDSPEVFRHGGDLYLVARRDVGGPYDAGDDDLSLAERRSRYLIAYSLRPKRTALYKIDQQQRKVVHVMDLPGAGDTAYAAVQQTGPDTYLVANYTSPLDDPDISWLRGQTSTRGTQIYLLTLTFVPYVGPPRTATPTWTPTPSPTPRSGPEPARIALSPVFAAPGTPLAITWPNGPELVGQLDLGDGTLVDPSTTTHDYPNIGDAIFHVTGSYELGNVLQVPVSGAVARTNARASTPLNGFTLTQPSDPVVQQVIRGIMPAFYYALADEQLAVAADPTGQGAFRFEAVTTWPLARGDSGFTTSARNTLIELSGVGGTATGLFVHVQDSTWSGQLDAANTPVSPITWRGNLVLEDVAAAAEVLAGLDHTAAVGFLAGLFGFDPSTPPALLPFEGSLAVTPSPRSS
jgi:hypothetical protein